ncbi:hypothetical protein [Flavobacterium panacagri]|uniref:hypothetical protein n=1 Tax=Flavobacterium panacagri TaxID=3034146 RepID=UPI0025A57367|nr:hypothetical protein [Flavobacterium panacagri]
MKIVASLSIILLLFSCNKKDTINHYLPKPITQKELIDNGFYKYTSIDTIRSGNEYEENIDDTIKSIIKYNMYSNVKPEENDKKQLRPTQLWHFFREDSIKKKTNLDYLKNKLNDRIITYLFRNDTLMYKDIIVFSLDKSRKEIANFTSMDEIIKYYDSLKISIKPQQIKNEQTGKIHSNRFMLDNYETQFYVGNSFDIKNNSYDIFINYKERNYHDVLENLYGNYFYCH